MPIELWFRTGKMWVAVERGLGAKRGLNVVIENLSGGWGLGYVV